MKRFTIKHWFVAIVLACALIPLSPAAEAATTGPTGAQYKRIDVNLTTQRLVAYERGRVVYRALVSTGKNGFETRVGTFHVYYKLKDRTMRGCMKGQCWVVPHVPNVMYFDEGRALHGTYWHNLFGTGRRLSHGCVNLSLKDAAWLYRWAPVGTKVVIHR